MTDIIAAKKKPYIRRWTEVSSPLGVVQIIHGMAEHSGRYHDLAAFLNREGYIVIASDHRGHGRSASSLEDVGDISHPFRVFIEDEEAITRELREEYPSLPIFILGHSMGSFIAQEHMKTMYSEVGGYILSGSCRVPYLKTMLGGRLAAAISLLTKNSRSPLMDRLLFMGYNKGIENPATSFDWLSREGEVVRKYVEDPCCGFIYTADFYAGFLSFISDLFSRDSFSRVNTSLPIFILSGDRDPVGFYGRGVEALNAFYRDMNFEDIWYHLYPGGRHEMINETGRDRVFRDILTFIQTYTGV